MKRLLMYVLLVTILGLPLLRAQTPGEEAILRLDPALDAIVSLDASLELLKGDYFGHLEGPVWVQEGRSGYLLFSDIPANRIYKWTPAGEISVFLERSGFTGTDTSMVGAEFNNGLFLIGSNGLTLDPQGRLVIAAMGDRTVVQVEKDGTRNILADRYDGKRFGGPNDLVVKSDGAVYFTDMTAGLRGRDKSPLRELLFNGVYLVKDGQVRLLDKDPQGHYPNGIAFSPDEKYLYVNGGTKITRYNVQPDGTVTNGRLFIDMSAGKVPGNADGMKVDQKGNVYCTGPGGVWIMSPEGKHLGTIRVRATNFAFGDADSKSIYFTAGRNLYRIRVNTPGVRPGHKS